MSFRLIVILLVCAGTFGSCSRNFRLKHEQLATPSPWPVCRADNAASGSLADASFDGQLNLIWKTRVGDRPAGPLTLCYNKLIVSGSRKRVWFFDINSGQNLGKVRLHGIPQSGVTVQDSMAYVAVAPPRNRLYGYDLIHRKQRWEARIKDAAGGSIIVGNRLIMSSGDGALAAIDPKTGQSVWIFSADGKLVAPACYADGRLFVGSDRGWFYAISLSDGKEIFRVNLKGPVVNAAAVAQYVYVADVKGNCYALSPSNGAISWQVTVPAPIWTAPSVSDNRVVLGHSGGDVVAFDTGSGREMWRFGAVEVVKASPIIVGRFVVVGTMAGTLLVLDGTDGSLVSKTSVDGGIACSPVSDGSRLYVATQTGRILCYGEPHEQPSQKSH